MKIRTLVATAALAAGVASTFAAAPASAWTCPEKYTNTQRLYHPLTGQPWLQYCTPDLNCETCFVVEP